MEPASQFSRENHGMHGARLTVGAGALRVAELPHISGDVSWSRSGAERDDSFSAIWNCLAVSSLQIDTIQKSHKFGRQA